MGHPGQHAGQSVLWQKRHWAVTPVAATPNCRKCDISQQMQDAAGRPAALTGVGNATVCSVRAFLPQDSEWRQGEDLKVK